MPDILKKYFTEFTEHQLQQFATLQPLYKEWNEKINVISRKDIDELYERHILHSLAIAAIFNFKDGATIIDLGTGGGFPGVPLAILFPNVQFLLVDSINKKLTVINAIAENLGLKNITTLHSRIEDIKGKKVDFVVSRAVAPLKKLWQWSKPLLKKNDTSKVITDFTQQHSLICLKGGDLTTEIFESGTKPRVWEIDKLFHTEYFKEKFILQVV
jgi:16S rRNA (guanine527-N7)-methyltransferase